MKKQILCLGLLLGLGLPAFAQQAVPTATLSRADSAQAVHRLFSKHRTGGIVWAVIGAAFTGRIAGAAASGSGNAGGAVVGILALGGVPAGIGVGKLVRFSGSREAAAISALEAGKGLPHYVQRRLRNAKYFRD
ncbi:hypothetical protein [Hymenobacter properus]|uniref:Uncharacterized protein n=1 Tax=Hymenobacter properus TaxID=2791026 RepID=A0A931BGY7_9BACT|nr:hypothetical protein [Hymenobacter properus]MBF9143739.1 hypothetical protein [Hymenobacter properus]MBR7722552.1 hypothetical protein [Microvirga sp. SRT04]